VADDHKKKSFLDPEIAFFIGAGFWWCIKTMAQAVAGWIGIQVFKTMYDTVKGWIWGKDEGKGTSEEISEEESAAASHRSLSGGRNGGRVLPGEGQSDQP